MGSIANDVGRVPMVRSGGLLVTELEDETVVYDLETKQAHCLKPLAATVFAGADGAKTRADLAELASYRLGTPVTEAQVADAVAQLDAAGLLEAPLRLHLVSGEDESEESGVSRRQALRRIGYAGAGAAMATTLITSIVAPSAALATGSGIPTGCNGCGKNPDCLSNHCCQGVSGKQCNSGCCVGANNSCHGSNCTCVGGSNNGLSCDSATCPDGNCVCSTCTVCATQTNPCPTSCPSGSQSCCVTSGPACT